VRLADSKEAVPPRRPARPRAAAGREPGCTQQVLGDRPRRSPEPDRVPPLRARLPDRAGVHGRSPRRLGGGRAGAAPRRQGGLPPSVRGRRAAVRHGGLHEGRRAVRRVHAVQAGPAVVRGL
ncbi:MAG: hypothetical protein AVDCRST_MAG59-971, partial [uncultured Thermomicrobiales bacterium]